MGVILFQTDVIAKSTQEERKKAQQQLKVLRAKIKRVNQGLIANRKQYGTELYQLNLSEKQLAELTRKLKNNLFQQRQERRQLLILNHKRNASNIMLSRQLASLSEEARLAFLQGRMSYLKILLSNHSTALTQRGLIYHRYIQKYRQQQVADINRRLLQLKKLEIAIYKRRESLQNLRLGYIQQQKKIALRDIARRFLLKRLAEKMKNKALRLRAHEKSRLELAAILKVIKTTPENLPVTKVVFKKFGDLKGSMNWPVRGNIASRFGKKHNNGTLHTRGVFIKAPIGAQVAAISYGQVVYADWLRGYGLIVAIDHGDDYLTLYGHNQTLYKQVGDWVKAGEIIAATGDSGGLGYSGLYFEIRKRGIPLNPVKWCRKLAKNKLTSKE